MALKIFFTSIVLLLLFHGAIAQKITVKEINQTIVVDWDNKERLNGGSSFIQNNSGSCSVKSKVQNEVAIFTLEKEKGTVKSQEFAGIFFNVIPALKEGITLWRYKPWNSWSKPIRVTDATQMPDWDVQFFYWQYKDSTYGAAVPLSGNGYRTTLGNYHHQWGSKAVSYATNETISSIPALAVSFGRNPYELFERIYRVALQEMGEAQNRRVLKRMPEPLQYIGWCTWNASNNGRNLNEAHIIEGVKTFTDHHFPLGWVLVDDGWFRQKNNQLQSFYPDSTKFPNGFQPLVQRLKNEYGVKYAGIWHAFDGYWNGIDPASELGNHYKNELFAWKQKESPNDPDTAPLKTYYFIRPDSDSLFAFYNTWHQYFKKEGFDFVKVDNQLVTERMAVNTYPIFSLSKAMHKALYQSINKNFGGAVINCMDMTADAYFNFGMSAVARSVEDYFPYQPGETYNLQHGNAAAHVLQAVYNAIYFSQMVYPDFDMFQSHHPNGVYHAIARTLNNGPIYLTDVPGQQNFDLLNKIVFKDGKTIRAATALLPTEDCLFQLQDAKLFKTFSRAGEAGLLGLWNAADADSVNGSFKASDVNGLRGDQFVLYEYFKDDIHVAGRNATFNLTLPRMGYELVYVIPVKKGFAAFGLMNKYNAPATILSQQWKGNKVLVKLYEGGEFRAYADKKPGSVLVNGKETKFSYSNRQLNISISDMEKPVIKINWEK